MKKKKQNLTVVSEAPAGAAERNYGIDLLRFVLMYMVCILHTLKQGGILEASTMGTPEYKTFWFIEIAAYCAVDAFALISGYTAVNKARKGAKLVDMWFQAFFFSFVVSVVLTLLGFNEGWSGMDLVKCALPVTFNKFWYFTAFFGLFFAIPILNKFIFAIDEKTAGKALLLSFGLFSVLSIVNDSFVLKGGYTTLWLIVLYCMGAFSKKIRLFEKKSSFTLLALWALCIFGTWYLHAWRGIDRFVNYVSPTILLSGILMVVLFSRLHLKGTILKRISPLVFGIYLFQLNRVVWCNILKDAFVFVADKDAWTGAACVLGIAAAIFVISLSVETFRYGLAKLLRIPKLSEKIAVFIDWLLAKTTVLLK